MPIPVQRISFPNRNTIYVLYYNSETHYLPPTNPFNKVAHALFLLATIGLLTTVVEIKFNNGKSLIIQEIVVPNLYNAETIHQRTQSPISETEVQ